MNLKLIYIYILDTIIYLYYTLLIDVDIREIHLNQFIQIIFRKLLMKILENILNKIDLKRRVI